MKRTTRTLLIVLVLAIVMALSVFAAWNQYQGNDDHNGQITDTTPPPISPSPTVTTAPLKTAGTGWSGVDTSPVMEKYNNVTYAYVTYNGRSEGIQLSCINCNNGTREWSEKISSTNGGNQLSTPYLDETNGIIYVAATNYYWYLQNSEFATTLDWVPSTGASITATGTDETSYATIPVGESIAQTFNNSATGTISTQLTSAIKLVSAGNTATVTFTLTRPNNSTETWTETVSTTTWKYVLHTESGKVNSTGNYTMTVSVSGADVIVDYVSFSRQTSGIQAYNRDGSVNRDNVAVATYGGQINTPLTVYGQYLYFGTFNGSYKYYQVDLNNTNTATNTKCFTGHSHFYWAGAYADNEFVYFGGDGGYFYKQPVAHFDDTSTNYGRAEYALSDAGNIRSSICHDNGNLYFTSQGGYLWRYNIASEDIAKAYIGTSSSRGCSTSTPAISNSGYIYIGSYGNTYKGIFKINKNFTNNTSMTQLSDADPDEPNPITTLPVQASVLVYTNDSTDYIFFTTNIGGGRGYCYSCANNGFIASKKWDTGSGNWTLQGMAACDGYLTFGNDANTFYVVH